MIKFKQQPNVFTKGVREILSDYDDKGGYNDISYALSFAFLMSVRSIMNPEEHAKDPDGINISEGESIGFVMESLMNQMDINS